MTRPRLLVVCFTALGSDPRVQRQLRALTDGFAVTAAGHSDPCIEGVEYLAVEPRAWSARDKMVLALQLKAGLYERAYWSGRDVRSALRALAGRSFDVVVANDVHTLPLALRVAGQAPVVLDAHEYAPAEFDEIWRWRFFFKRYNEYLCAQYIPRVAGMATVSAGIADAYQRRYGVEPVVVPNAPGYRALRPAPVRADCIRLLHHGIAVPSRRLELLLHMARQLDERFQLDLLLMPTVPAYHRHLCALAERTPRVRVLAPVPMHELITCANAYDIGVILYPPSNFNMKHALPNKFFEFVQARLAIAIGPSNAMAPLARRYGFGIVAADFSPGSLAASLNALSLPQLQALKERAHAAAAELCAEKFAGTLIGTVRKALDSARCAA